MHPRVVAKGRGKGSADQWDLRDSGGVARVPARARLDDGGPNVGAVAWFSADAGPTRTSKWAEQRKTGPARYESSFFFSFFFLIS
jgi:hypothetical protein